MFTNNDIRQITNEYFEIIQMHEDNYEIKSKNTEHFWIIKKVPLSDVVGWRIVLHHKHTRKDQYYHKHSVCNTVKKAIEMIMDHDKYVININNEIEEMCKNGD